MINIYNVKFQAILVTAFLLTILFCIDISLFPFGKIIISIHVLQQNIWFQYSTAMYTSLSRRSFYKGQSGGFNSQDHFRLLALDFHIGGLRFEFS